MKNQTVEEAEKLAKRILTRKIRKSLGEYYIFWSTFVVVLGIIFFIPFTQSLIPYLYTLLVLVYAGYTEVIFYKAYSKREFLRTPKSKLKYFLFITLILAAVGVWAYLLDTLNDFTFDALSDVIITTIISILLYDVVRDTGRVRYYDYLAIASFVLSNMLGPFNYLFFFIYFFFWVYAGVKSIIESYEGTEDEQ